MLDHILSRDLSGLFLLKGFHPFLEDPHVVRLLRDLARLVHATEGFSGAEIEHCVVEGLFLAFDQSRELGDHDLLKAASETVPLSVTSAEELRRSRAWASKRARPAERAGTLEPGASRAARIEFGSGDDA